MIDDLQDISIIATKASFLSLVFFSQVEYTQYMRVIVILLKTFGAVAAIVAMLFFGGREVLLLLAKNQIQNEVEKMRAGTKSSNEYAVMCAKMFTITEQVYALEAIQLRFTSDHTYNVEIVCVQRESDPIALRSGSLPPFVSRLPGSSGLVFAYNRPAYTYVEVSTYGRTSRLAYKDAGVTGKSQLPVAACEGWGYQCCDAITTVPVGGPASGQVTDCPGGCFSSCKQRPLILSFRSEPRLQAETRSVTVKKDQAVVNFSVIAANPGVVGGVKRVELDYGDGTRDTFTKEQISMAHTYSCATVTCSYTAKVVAYDADGLNSPDIRTSSMTVVVE